MSEDIHRSWLFVPGDRPERFAKASAAGADAVIIDLEDAVPAASKNAAREHARQWLRAGHPAYLRINASGSAWCGEDLALAGLAKGIMLPKAEQAGDIARVMAAGAPCVLPLIESALGMWQAHALASQPGVQRLVFGNIDFALDLGISGEEDEPLLHFRSQLVLVSRVAGIQPPVDGVTTSFNEEDVLRRDSLRAKRMGFGGKLCIHPRQVAAVNLAYAPTVLEIEWARQVEQAAAAADGAAVSLHGKMIDRPVILRAQEILRELERLASRTQ
jgi:citrate lyase subunit beta/citryl-CoA lyase